MSDGEQDAIHDRRCGFPPGLDHKFSQAQVSDITIEHTNIFKTEILCTGIAKAIMFTERFSTDLQPVRIKGDIHVPAIRDRYKGLSSVSRMSNCLRYVLTIFSSELSLRLNSCIISLNKPARKVFSASESPTLGIFLMLLNSSPSHATS